jgi:hypothetical protein
MAPLVIALMAMASILFNPSELKPIVSGTAFGKKLL